MSNQAQKEEFEMPTITAVKSDDNEHLNNSVSDNEITEQSNLEIVESETQSAPVSDTSPVSTIDSQDDEIEDDEIDEEEQPKSKRKLLIAILAFVLLSGSGAGIYAHKNGYLGSIPGAQGITSEISQQEAEYNQRFAELSIKLNDVEGALDSTATQNEILDLRASIERMETDFNNRTTTLVNNLKNELNREHSRSLTSIQNEVAGIQKELGQLTSKDSVTYSDLDSLQRKLEHQIRAIESQKTEAPKPQATNTSNNSRSGSSNTSTPNSTGTSNEPQKTETYAGLVMTDSFLWANQHIATLSDSRGTDFQVARGDTFGHYLVTKVTSSEVHIKNQTTSRQVVITKG
ncbi:hypothetical protein [Photobacterium lutimaris]|uniref:Uncharacterized protein n=1 Tax=Photobacterium lutimaris TaxID=388278 RepID=A0A2T3ITJ3_9GAMM|nr:hypothetical protein [Photobacterium lutimaris]PSU31686.1 hypothetical protein C9I99_21095 [Photobacterium lutimaris]TDR72677.1 hypothetical protein DFP78_113153 [Photobacterium lutimaris]